MPPGTFRRPADPAAFDLQVREVCETYRAAPERLKNEGIHTVCVDEKPGIQALERKAPTDPSAGWIFVADNLTTHCSATLVLLIAGLCALPTESLGKKGTSGVLKSVATRKAFLTDASHRIRFVSVPKHTSWLNRVEIWFSVLTRRVLKRGDFRSKAELRNRVLEFIAYFDRTMAKPYKWTFAGRPLNV